MPTYETPEPISAAINVAAGAVRIVASDRTDTVVEVRPNDPSSAADVQAAERTRVEYAQGRLSVIAPKENPRSLLKSLLGWGLAVDVTIELPTDSRVDVEAAGEVRGEGRIGDCRLKSGVGDVRLDQTGRLHVRSVGNVAVRRSVGHTDIATADGEIWVGEIAGTAAVKTANGDIAIGEIAGEARMTTANGDITIERALAGVAANTAYGAIRIGEVRRSAVVLRSAAGDLEVGIAAGTAAWLDVNTVHGTVRNGLEPADGPGSADDTVEVRARTADGDIVIRRC